MSSRAAGRRRRWSASSREGCSAVDADLLRELVLGVLRWKAALDAEIAAHLPDPAAEARAEPARDPRGRSLPAPASRPDPAVCRGQRGRHARARERRRGRREARERRAARHPAPAAAGRARGGRAGRRAREVLTRILPFWSSAGSPASGPQGTRRMLAADNAPPRLDLLVNPRRTTRNALVAALGAEGVEAERSALTPLGLTAVAGNPLRTSTFSAGHFSVQDLGAQVLPLLLPPGELLVDLAAAPGGKSLSALAHGRARRTFALDASLPPAACGSARTRAGWRRTRFPRPPISQPFRFPRDGSAASFSTRPAPERARCERTPRSGIE